MFCIEFAPNSIIIVIFASRNTDNTSCFRKERKKWRIGLPRIA